MIYHADARARVIRILDDDCEESVGAKRRTLIADKIIAALYAPRTRLREVVAPSGRMYKYEDGQLWISVVGRSWATDSFLHCNDAAVVADLLARPTEAVPSEESVVTADALDAKRYRAWRALTLSAAPKQTPQQLDEAVDEMVAQQGAPS